MATSILGASRSGLMIACLRHHQLYSEKRARDLLFDAIESILVNHLPPGNLSRLTREAAWQARHAAVEMRYPFHNWESASCAVGNAMLHAGVLLDEGGRAVELETARVVRLREGFRDRTEAWLIEFLIGQLGDVSVRDHKALGHALFRQFDPVVPIEALEQRAVHLLERLSSRVRPRHDGIYEVIESRQEPGDQTGIFAAKRPPISAASAIRPTEQRTD